MAGFLSTLRNLGPGRLMTVLAVLIGVMGFLIYIMTRISNPNMTLLYGELELSDSAEIAQTLDGMKIPYETRNDGSQILVPADQVSRLRMLMAEEGLPNGGTMGYEIFDESEGFGRSNFVQNINQLRAMEGELSRTIASLRDVKAARVHLVLPQRKLFSKEEQKPTASIVLNMRRAGKLDREKVLAIQHLVAAAVPELSPQNISIVDSQGNLLARGTEGEDEGVGGMRHANDLRVSFENRTARQLEELLSSSVGFGNVRVEVAAEIDFDRITMNAERYDPEGQVVRSSQTVQESSNSSESNSDQAVSVFNNVPGADTSTGQAAGGNNEATERVEETTNYEITRIIESKVRESGEIRRLSVAVLVDGIYEEAADGTKTYQPRGAEEIQKLDTLIKSAIGFNEDRGDQVEVINMQFNRLDTEFEDAGEGGAFDLTKQDYMKLAELLVLGLVGILVMLLVVRPIINRIFESMPAPQPQQPGGGTPLLNDQSKMMALPRASDQPDAQALPEEDNEEMINLSQVEGQVKASTVKRIGEIIEKHPEETVSQIRNWIYDAQGGGGAGG